MGPISPLDGPDAKVKRAYENISDLKLAIDAFLSDTEFSLTFKSHTRHETVFSHGRTRIPYDLSVRIGEVLHNLRSGLDHLYFELVSLRRIPSAREERAIQFPICRYAKDYPALRKGVIQPWVPVAALALLDALQPCHNPPPEDYPLQIISDLNNADKHRLVVVGVAQVDAPISVVSKLIGQLNAGVSIPQGMEVYRHKATDIRFPKFGAREMQSVVPSLIQLTDATKGVVSIFRHLFS